MSTTTVTTNTATAHTSQKSFAPLKWFRRILTGGLVTLIVFALLGFTYETIAGGQDAQRFPAPGIMADAGGFNLHLNISGEANNTPTVILEAGNGGFSTQWMRVQEAVSQYTRVVSYDRAGLGWSESSDQARDAVTAARQLHTALENAGIEGPYVLVGHSLGGLFVRAFTSQYPDEVAGLVLIDTAHPDAFELFPQEVAQTQQTLRGFSDIAALLSQFGVFRLTGPLFAEGIADLPAEAQEISRAIGVTPRYLQALSAEYHAWWPTMIDQVRQMDTLGERPLIVIAANTFPGGMEAPAGYWEAHLSMQEDLATLSTNSEFRIADGATHYSIIMDEQDSQTVITAIQDVLSTISQ